MVKHSKITLDLSGGAEVGVVTTLMLRLFVPYEFDMLFRENLEF